MLRLSRPSEDEIRRFIEAQAPEPLSYAEVGSTRTGAPAGYDVDHNRAILGSGPEAFARGVEAMGRWQMHAVPRVQLCWPAAPIAEGTTVAVLARYGPLWTLNGCRVVYVVDEPGPPCRRFGFAYGTLPAHVERGEERFLIEWDTETGEVAYDLYAFSRPSRLPLRLFKPLVRREQRRFAAASKQAMVRAVAKSA